MLVLFFGVSGVGKTTIMNALHNSSGWKYVPTFMTRPLRPEETGKFSISQLQFRDMELNGEFLFVNNFFGNLYGTPRKQIEEAVRDCSAYWMMDFPIVKRESMLNLYPYIGIIVFPESIEQLEDQILKSGRESRLKSILEDFYQNHLPYQHMDIKPPLLFNVINYKDRVQKIIKEINILVSEAKHECLNRSRN